MNLKLDASELKFKRRDLRNNSSAVSEAIGTIILLGIAITLIGVVAAWVQTVPEIPEQKQVNLFVNDPIKIAPGKFTIDIEHRGGDTLFAEDTEIRIIVSHPTFENYFLGFSDSGTPDVDDGTWDIGDHWNYTLSGLGSSAELEINIIDVISDRLILTKDILLGKLDRNLPDFEVSPYNITFSYIDKTIRKNKPVTISVIIFNKGNANASGIVRFFDDNRLITTEGVGYKSVSIPFKITPTTKNYEKVSMRWIPERWGMHKIQIKVYSPQYETNYANNYAEKDVEVEFHLEPPKGPDLAVSRYEIQPSVRYPFHGNDLNLSIIMHNLGDLAIPPTDSFNVTISLGNRTTWRIFSNGFNARDSMEFFVMFREIGPGGMTQIRVHIDPEDVITEMNNNNNIAVRDLQILPTILLVDDDGAEQGKFNVADELMKSMTGRGITYDYYNVKGPSDVNPRYNAGPKKLKNFDIIIWITGYQTNNTLTPVNIEHLTTWLNDSSTNNSLWLIGQDMLNSTVTIPGLVNESDFAYEYIGLDSYFETGVPEILYGVVNDTITDGMELNTSDYLENMNRGVKFKVRSSTTYDKFHPILENIGELGFGFSMALRHQNFSANYKLVYFGFEYSSINDLYDLSNVTYQVLKWFNYTLEQGYDFGIINQDFSTLNPDFMDVITISATVVNNGPDTEEVYVLFTITDPLGQEFEVEEYPEEDVENPQKINIPGNGGRLIVEKEWLATSVGVHDFRVMVDPYDHFQEIIEENNDFSYYDLEVTKLKIQYTILVVNDDNSTDNGGLYQDTVTSIKTSLEELNYYYVEYVVGGGLMPEDGPNTNTLKHYNAVLWLTGNDPGPTLTNTDQQNLEDYLFGNYIEAKYLRTKVNLLLVGQNILDDINGSGNNIVPGEGFVRDYLKISEYSTGIGLTNTILGIKNNPISHGAKIPLVKSFLDASDIVVSSSKNNYLFWQNKVLGNYNSIFNEHERNHSRVVFLPWELSFVDDTEYGNGVGSNETYQNELIYLILNWFGYPQNTVELKITEIDINISEEHPNTGDSYIMSADVFNYGNLDSSVIVRFYDGNSIIDTDTIFVPKQGKSSAEVIWVPHFAGNRTITVYIDRNNDIPEIFEILNNNASLIETWVYFFYDDLEDGTSNWNHDSTITRINTESTLDYMDEPVHTNINGTWNWSDSQGFAYNTTDYHSFEGVYYTIEPWGVNKGDVLLALVIDDSASMTERKDGSGSTWLSVAKNASKYLISQISDLSNVTIWHFKGNNEERSLSFTPLAGTGRDIVNNAIDSLDNPSGTTILWDAIGEAYQDVKDALPFNQDLTPAVVVLSDGMDIQSSDKSGLKLTNAINKVEGGSNVWGPWHEMYIDNDTGKGYKSAYYDIHYGKYTIDWSDYVNETYWLEAMAKGSMEHTRKGLLNSNIPIYTIGLGLEHHEVPNEPIITNWPGDSTKDIKNATCTDTSPFCIESGTLEFNLWRIATTSRATYFYSPTSNELKDIFRQIALKLGAQLTRSASSPSTGQTGTGYKAYSGEARSARSSRASWKTILRDGFETNDWTGGPWSAATGWSVQSGWQHNGTYYAESSGSYVDSTLTLNRDLDLTYYENVRLIFWQYTYDTENNDRFRIDISTDSGGNWTNIITWDGEEIKDDSDVYHEYFINLSAYDGISTFRIRFRYSMNSANEWWLIDDIFITGIYTYVYIDPLYLPGDRNLTTFTFNLENISSAKVSFYQKYNIRLGMNGVVVLIGTPSGAGNTWLYQYANPRHPYTGNYDVRKARRDDFGNIMLWCWNGISSNNLYGWEYVEISLNNWTGLSEVRVRLSFLWSSWGVGGMYMIDDFEIKVEHGDGLPIDMNTSDQWQYTSVDSYSGNYCWWNGNPATNNLTGGIDNSLYTRSIDITNARNATLSAYFKFNINTAAGRPPDGFRVEVSNDNGVTWDAINFGVRSAWGVSGNDSDDTDGVPGDGKSYTGIDSGDNWVEANSLTRLNCDLTGWAGEVIRLRFRVVTAIDSNPFFGGTHYESANAGFGGFYVDDVIVYGFSLLE